MPEPLPVLSPPLRALPRGACDSHTHVFGPADLFPRAEGFSYDPPPATSAAHRDARRSLGFERAILVQPGIYDQDCSALLDAIAQSGGALRGIGSAPPAISDADLEKLAHGGVSGLRFVEVPDPKSGGRYAGSVGFDDLARLAPRMRAHGLAAEIWADAKIIAEQRRFLEALGVPLIVEHFARIDPSKGLEQTGFAEVCAMLAERAAWIKVTIARIAGAATDPHSGRPYFDALVKANPSGILWGSDWPYVRMGDKAPNAGHLLDDFEVWLDGDDALRQAIFVDNPARAFNFANTPSAGLRHDRTHC